MPQSAEEIFELHRSRTDQPDLSFVDWLAFPWAVEDGRIVAKKLVPPTEVDRVRGGEGGTACLRCEHPDEGRLEQRALDPRGEPGGPRRAPRHVAADT